MLSDEEGVVVVLLVGGEDDVVAHFAPGYGRVIAHHGVVEAHAEFKVYVLAQHEAHGDTTVFAGAAVAHHAVGQHDAVFDAGGGIGIREEGDVVEGVGVLDGAVAAHMAVGAVGGGETLAGHGLEAFYHLAVVAVFGPQVGIADSHAGEGEDATAAILVHGFYPGILILYVGGRGGHLVNVEQQAVLAYAIATEHAHIVQGAVVAHRGVGKHRVVYSFRQVQVAVVQAACAECPKS